MKYYCSTIPPTLAEKLKEKGCEHPYAVPEAWEYGFIFDWFLDKGLRIVIEPSWDFANEKITDMWDCDIVRVGVFSSQPKTTISTHDTWHEAANAAIEKAITLI